jgi:carboxyl-terminal processing protease
MVESEEEQTNRPLAGTEQIDRFHKKVVAAVRSYYPEADLHRPDSEEIAVWLNRIAPGSRIQKTAPASLEFIRGLEPERSVEPIERLSPTILYLKISFWGRRTVMEAHRQIAQEKARLEKEGGGLILDLRGNQGGQVEAALEMVDALLPAGRTVATIHPIGKEAVPYQTSFRGPYYFPVVLLVDHRTASSSELFSGILQGEKRAHLIGTPTAGKDTIQSAIPLDATHLLLLTTGHFQLPGRPRLQGRGLSPDELVQENENPKERAEAFFKRPDSMSGK